MDIGKQARRRKAIAELRKAVKAAGGTTAVAKAMGTTRAHVGNITSGRRVIGRVTAMRLVQVVKVSAATLLVLMEPKPAAEDIEANP